MFGQLPIVRGEIPIEIVSIPRWSGLVREIPTKDSRAQVGYPHEAGGIGRVPSGP